MNIINIRGTSGSGKSTLVRKIMSLYPEAKQMRIEGRKQPAGYVFLRDGNPLVVLGHYETECGGCDTFSSKGATEAIYKLARDYADLGYDVLFEGLMLSAEARRMIELANTAHVVTVIALTTPMEECLAGVLDRRARRGAVPEPGPNTVSNLENKMKGTVGCVKRFRNAGMTNVFELTRQEAFEKVKEILGC